MEFVGYVKSSDEKIEENDLIDFNFSIREKDIQLIEIQIEDDLISLDFNNGVIKKNSGVLFSGFDSESVFYPKLFRRKTFEVGNNNRKITEKYFFGYVTGSGVEKYLTFDGLNYELVDER